MQLHNRKPSHEEIVDATGLSSQVVKKSLETYQRCKSLDAPVDTEGDTTLGNLIADQIQTSPDHQLSVRESQEIEVQELLGTLPPRTKTVLSMYFGIGFKHPQSLDEIGDYVGLSRDRVRQIKERGLRRLRSRHSNMIPEF